VLRRRWVSVASEGSDPRLGPLALFVAERRLDEFRVYSFAEQERGARMVKAVARVARYSSVTAYNVDKLFWLIGSGHFYDKPEIGLNRKIGRRKKSFIETAQTVLQQEQWT
jgi:hypothetical protein